MANVLELELSSSGLFGNPKILKIKEYSFSQIHELVSAYDSNDMVRVLQMWVDIMKENTLEPLDVDYGNFTIDEMTEVLIQCHFNFINSGLSTWVEFKKTKPRIVSLNVKDITFNMLKLDEEGKDLNRITIQKKSETPLVGTALRVTGMMESFKKSADFRRTYKAKNFEAYRLFEIARESGREDTVSEKVQGIIEEGLLKARKILDESFIAHMIIAYGDSIPADLNEKIKMLSQIPPGPLLALEDVITETFYHGPSKTVKYEGDNGRCSFQLPNILQAMRKSDSKDYEVSLG